MDERGKWCCSDLYESDLVQMILGDSFHPGGEKLTLRLAELLSLSGADRVLDIASGRGTTAILLAKTFGCKVIGVDRGMKNMKKAREISEEQDLSSLVSFTRGKAKKLPFGDEVFDVVTSECSFSIFPDKERVAIEIHRVLKPSGRLGIADMTVNTNELPDDMREYLWRAACIANAQTVDKYVEIFRKVGFKDFRTEGHNKSLFEMIEIIKNRIFIAELGSGLSKLDINIDFEKANHLISRVKSLLHEGKLGYVLITAKK
jgi:hypothetical protein